MNEPRENVNLTAEPQPKKAWHVPTLEETSYASTEVAGVPGGTFDGYAFYSVA